MQMVNAALISIGICGAAMLTAQEPSSPAVANAIDQEILKLKDLPDNVRARAIKDLAFRIRRGARALRCCPRVQPCNRRDRRMRARHLAGSGNDSRRRAAQVATPGHRRSCVPDVGRTGSILSYGGFARRPAVHGCNFQAPSRRPASQRGRLHSHRRSGTEMELEEPARQGGAGQLLGHLVPPCRREIPDLDELYKRFRDQGLVILAIAGEEASIVRPFISQQIVSYPVLLDPARKVKELFLVDGIPESFVYDREGRLVAQAIDRPAMQGFLNMLRQAGLQ